jgi:hypothetical protein
MQRRLLEAHMKKTPEPIKEVEALLENLLDGWRQAAKKAASAERESNNHAASLQNLPAKIEQRHSDGGSTGTEGAGTGGLYNYWNEGSDNQLSAAYSF